jgi:hypothetical protein
MANDGFHSAWRDAFLGEVERLDVILELSSMDGARDVAEVARHFAIVASNAGDDGLYIRCINLAANADKRSAELRQDLYGYGRRRR